MKKQQKPYMYFQEWGTYPDETVVCVGATKEQARKWIEKNCTKNYLKFFEESDFPTIESLGTEDRKMGGFVVASGGSSFLWLSKYEKSFEFYDCLVHECLHLVQFILMEYRNFSTEYEGQAYQQEYLVQRIRRHLNKHYDKKAKK